MLAVLAIAALMQLRGATPAASDPSSQFAAEVTALRLRWHAGLDAAGWDADAPAARRLADELTAEAFALRVRSPGARAAPDAFALDQLVARMGGTGVHALVRERPLEYSSWIEPWLRWGAPRTDEVHAVIDQAGLERGLLEAVVRWRPAEAAPLLRSAATAGRWEAACAAVLELPAALRVGYVSLLSEGAQVGASREGATSCVAALAIVPRTRTVAAQRLMRTSSVPQVVGSPVAHPRGTFVALGGASTTAHALGLAVTLAGTAQDAQAQRALASTLRSDSDARGDVATFQAVRMVATFAPWLRPSAPLARAARALAVAAGSSSWHLTTARLRWRDPALLEDSLAVLATPGSRDLLVLWSARVVGALTPPTVEARRRATASLRSFSQATQGVHPTLSADEAARWSDALSATACAEATCLIEVFEGGTDERAAREVLTLGAAGLSELPAPAARALVARVVQRGRAGHEAANAAPGTAWSATAWAVFSTVEGCPGALRGLREAGLPPHDADLLVTPWRDALDQACRESIEAAP